MKRKSMLLSTTAAIIVSGAGNATGQTTEAQCVDQARPLPVQRLLRRVSLDLRGRIPSAQEIERQRAEDTVSETLVEAYLSSEDFIGVMRQHHEDLLWPNIDQIELVPETNILYPYPLGDGDVVYFSAVRAAFVRAAGAGNIFLPCRGQPAEYDANGNLVLEPVVVGGEVVAYQEGYVEVTPYWAPDTTVKVCGLDALDATTGVVCPGPADRYPLAEGICAQFAGFEALLEGPFRGSQTACNQPLSLVSPDCGCGPNLQYCATEETLAEIRTSLLEQELRIVDEIVRSNQPYDQILQTKAIEYNGPVVHYLRHMSGLSFDTYAGIDPTSPPPDLDYADRQWVPVSRTGRHAGVLTTPGYLLKFQTGRQRAHRFYNAFECSSFIPNGPLPSPFEPCSQRLDLTQRCGCDACHKTLEPLASHWGRYAEYGFLHMDEAEFPTVVDERCALPIASVDQFFECLRFYELDPVGEEEDYEGFLLSYVFRTTTERDNIRQGPTKMVQDSLASGRLDRCTVRRMWTHFMRREPNLDEDGSTIPDLTTAYVASGRSLKTLVKAIVLHPAYGRQP